MWRSAALLDAERLRLMSIHVALRQYVLKSQHCNSAKSAISAKSAKTSAGAVYNGESHPELLASKLSGAYTAARRLNGSSCISPCRGLAPDDLNGCGVNFLSPGLAPAVAFYYTLLANKI